MLAQPVQGRGFHSRNHTHGHEITYAYICVYVFVFVYIFKIFLVFESRVDFPICISNSYFPDSSFICIKDLYFLKLYEKQKQQQILTPTGHGQTVCKL